jgi:hypothetical protein
MDGALRLAGIGTVGREWKRIGGAGAIHQRTPNLSSVRTGNVGFEDPTRR